MPPKNKSFSKLLVQTTLFDSPVRATPLNRPPPTRTKRKRNAILAQASDDDDDVGLGSIKFEPKKPSVGSDDDLAASAPKRQRMATIADSVDSARRAKRTRLTKKPSEDEDKDEDTQQPLRRKLKKKRLAALTSSSDDEDLAQEVEKERILASRLRQRDKKTAFQKNLEKLKRRKQKKPAESPSEEESNEDNEGEEGSEDQDAPFKGAKPSSDYDSLFDEDSDATDSSDFIVEDDHTVVASLPMEFSMDSYQDLDYQFKRVFQFFVHIAARPAKERHHFMKELLQKEQYFSGPLQNTRRKLSGLRDSLVASSVWRPEFKRALGTYPEFDLIPLDFAIPTCHACHLGGRLSTLTGRLSGLPYDRWGFEIKEKQRSRSSDTSDNDDSDTQSIGSEDDLAVMEFHLGRFCAKRTRVYHEFTHWEYALFKCIREEVDELHECDQSGGFFRIAYAGGKQPPKDLDDADGICDWLDQRKVIDMEWTKLKDMMESARHLELDKKGDDD